MWWVFLLVLLPPAIFAVSNLIDKFLVSGKEEDSEAKVLLTTGGLFNLLIAVPIFLFILFFDHFEYSLPLFLNGILFTLGMWIYLYLMSIENVNRVAMWFQFIPIFGLLGGAIFLREILNLPEIVGIILIFVGSIILSYQKGKLNKKLIIFGLITALLICLNDIIFAKYGRELSLANALFYDILGKGIWGFLFLFSKNVRDNFFYTIKTKLKIQAFNEIVFIIGDAIFDIAKIFSPVAIVQAFGATQPLFVYIGDWLVMKFRPKMFSNNEMDINKKVFILGLVLIIMGGVLIGLFWV